MTRDRLNTLRDSCNIKEWPTIARQRETNITCVERQRKHCRGIACGRQE